MINFTGKLKQIKPMKSGNKVIFWTQEVPDELDRLQYTGEEGNVVFCPDEIKEAVIKAVNDKRPNVYDDRKQTGSHRLRGIIFQVFIEKYPEHTNQSTPESKEAWAKAYDAAMEVEINNWKLKLKSINK
jgi:hypothetical protein